MARLSHVSLLGVIRQSLILALSLFIVPTAFAGKPYQYFSLGTPKATVTRQPTTGIQSLLLMGGGYDVAESFRWLIQRAGITKASGGNFLVLRASGTDAYNPYIYSNLGLPDPTTPMNLEMVGGKDLGLSGVETLIIPSVTAANDPFVAARILAADVIWIAGGDQANYVNYWTGTPVQTLLNQKIRDGYPVGGTSAGNAILGQYAFAALNGTVTSSQALANPFNRYMTFDPPLPSSSSGTGLLTTALANTITDDHVDTRSRMGRLFSFVARMATKCSGPYSVTVPRPIGIGLDEETALAVAVNGREVTAQLVSNPPYQKTATLPPNTWNAAYFLTVADESNWLCQAGQPLTVPAAKIVGFGVSAKDLSSVTTTACSSTPQTIDQQSWYSPGPLTCLASNRVSGISGSVASFAAGTWTATKRVAPVTVTLGAGNGLLSPDSW